MERKSFASNMSSSNKAQVNENDSYLKESQKLLIKIEELTGAAADSVDKFDIKTNSDKICILTIGNNFARDLEYVLNNLQRITIDNHKKGDGNKNLKEAVRAFSSFIRSIQLAFGNDINKLKLEIINVLKNLDSKLKPLLEIVRDNSPHSSKSEIFDILDYLYIAIEKIKLRTEWEHLDYKEVQSELTKTYLDPKLAVLAILKDNEEFRTDFCRFSHKAVEGILQALEEASLDVDHYDDQIRDVVLKITNKIADSIFDFDKAIRNNYGMSEYTLYAKLCSINIIPSMYDVLGILSNQKLLDSNGKIKNFVWNSVINVLGCSIRFNRDWERKLF